MQRIAPHLTPGLRSPHPRVYEGPGIAVRKRSERVYENLRSKHVAGEITVLVVPNSSASGLQSYDVGSIPELQFRLVAGRIVAMSARLPSAGEDDFGWVWEYDWSAPSAGVTPPRQAMSIDAVGDELGTGSRSESQCAVGWR